MSRLVRSDTDRLVSGVCAGIARYVAIDPTWVRLAFILLTLTSFGVFVYFFLALLIPAESAADLPSNQIVRHNVDDLMEVIGGWLEEFRRIASESKVTAVLLIALGVVLLSSQFGWLGGGFLWPALLIGIGVYFIYRYRSSG